MTSFFEAHRRQRLMLLTACLSAANRSYRGTVMHAVLGESKNLAVHCFAFSQYEFCFAACMNLSAHACNARSCCVCARLLRAACNTQTIKLRYLFWMNSEANTPLFADSVTTAGSDRQPSSS